MRNIKLLTLLLSLFSTTLFAQENKYHSYFIEFLKNGTCEEPIEKNVPLKKINKVRTDIWNAWVDANQHFDEEKLIELDSISLGRHSHFNIPDSLEPNAKMPYYYGSKGICPEDGYPCFIYLHGSGPKEHEWSNGLKFAQTFKDGPSIYFVPQIPNEGQYYRWYQKSKQYVWEKVIRQLFLKNDVNPNKLYLFGISEGGYGSQRLASFYADYFAAAGPMAGGEPLKNAPAENCMNIGFCLRTGDKDFGFYRDILTRYTKTAFDSLESIYPNYFVHNVELIPGRGHSIDYRPTTPWLKKFVRNPWPKKFIWEDFEMDGVHRKGFYNIVVTERPDEGLRTRYDVDIHDNIIEISVHNVYYSTIQTDERWGIEMKFNRSYKEADRGKFVLYLNEHLVDLKKKVTVIVNGKTKYCGKLKCNVFHMMKSLSTFSDPNRIYPAAVELSIDNSFN